MSDDSTTANIKPESGSEKLLSFIERVERLEDERNDITSDIRQIYSEAKSVGYDVATLKTIVKLRKLEPSERIEKEKILMTYMAELKMDGV